MHSKLRVLYNHLISVHFLMQSSLQTRIIRISREQDLGILALGLAEAKTGRHVSWFESIKSNEKAARSSELQSSIKRGAI